MNIPLRPISPVGCVDGARIRSIPMAGRKPAALARMLHREFEQQAPGQPDASPRMDCKMRKQKLHAMLCLVPSQIIVDY